MRCEFAKLNGAGNDFVMIGDMGDKLFLTPGQVARICDRHFGVGADGVIVVKPSPRSECAAYMDYYNADGTKAQMCGNGVRCFAKFLVDRSYVSASAGSFVADTLAGPKPISFTLGADGTLSAACVDMGAPVLAPDALPTTLPASPIPEGFAGLADGTAVVEQGVCGLEEAVPDSLRERAAALEFTCVSMGNPHAVAFLDDASELDDALVGQVGSAVENAAVFPEKVNVEFAHVQGDGIEMRVWERGCGETLACGTGCCATAVAAHLTGRTGRQVHVHVLGGTIDVDWRDDGHVHMTGPAAESFSGVLDID
jgi:diaminopimelate epimerase